MSLSKEYNLVFFEKLSYCKEYLWGSFSGGSVVPCFIVSDSSWQQLACVCVIAYAILLLVLMRITTESRLSLERGGFPG